MSTRIVQHARQFSAFQADMGVEPAISDTARADPPTTSMASTAVLARPQRESQDGLDIGEVGRM